MKNLILSVTMVMVLSVAQAQNVYKTALWSITENNASSEWQKDTASIATNTKDDVLTISTQQMELELRIGEEVHRDAGYVGDSTWQESIYYKAVDNFNVVCTVRVSDMLGAKYLLLVYHNATLTFVIKKFKDFKIK